MRIETDLHCHTVASTHAYSTVTELASAAFEHGLKLFAITDHGPKSPDAPHIWHYHNFKVLPRFWKGVWLLKGIEANILDLEGNIDIPDQDYHFLEWIVASMHRTVMPDASSEAYGEAYCRLAKNNPEVDVIGHCTTDAFPFPYEPVLKCFKEYGKLVELNESSILYKKGARKNAVEVLRLCKQYEIPIVVDTDCHFHNMIGKTPVVQQMLEDCEFPPALVWNADAERVMEYITKKRHIEWTKASCFSEQSFGVKTDF